MRFFILGQDKKPLGPFEVAELKKRVGEHPDPQIQVCREGAQDWNPIVSVEELSDLFRGAAPPPAPGEAAAPSNKEQPPKNKTKKPTNWWGWGLFLVLVLLSNTGPFGVLSSLSLAVYAVVAKWKKLRSPFKPMLPEPIGWPHLAGAVSMGLIFAFFSVAVTEAKQKKIEEAAVVAQQEKVSLDKDKLRREANTKKFADRIGSWNEQVSAIIEEKTVKDLDSRIGKLETIRSQAQGYVKAHLPTGFSTPEFKKLIQSIAQQLAPLKQKKVVQGLIAKATDAKSSAVALMKVKDWLAAETSIKQAESLILALQKYDAAVVKQHAARGFSLKSLAAKTENLKKAITPKASAAKVYAELCGPAPKPSAWDGGDFQLQAQLEKGAYDPDSIDVENCTNAVLTAKKCWKMNCNVKGKNAFGMIISKRRIFYKSKLGWSE